MFQDQYASVQAKKNQSQAWFEAEQFIIIIIEDEKIVLSPLLRQTSHLLKLCILPPSEH